MKRGNLKSFIMGVLVTVMVMGLALPALASVGTKTAELYYNNIKIRLNGQELTPKDANGNVVEPFVINGTTYLPVRAIGEALGLNVSWDGKTQTVILGNDPASNQPAAWLNDLETFEGYVLKLTITDQQYNSSSKANNGDTFERYLYTNSNDGTVSYLLKGQYARLTGTFYLSNEYIGNGRVPYRILVYCDDNLVYTSPALLAGVEPIPFDIDVSNCHKLTIVSQRDYGNDSWSNEFLNGTGCYIGNAALWTK